VPDLKRAYLIHGDDHGRIAERRANLKTLAEREGGAGGVEVLEGDAATGETVAGALCAMTFALGRRVVIVDGVERWKDADVAAVAPVLEQLDDAVTVAFFGREEGRAKVPAGLAKAVERAGGDVRAEQTVKPWELPKWVQARGRELGLDVTPAASKTLVRIVGERQQRLLRELEKLSLALPSGATVEAEHVEELAASSAERRAWTLADALIARDAAAAARAYVDLRAQGERLTGLLFVVLRRLRDAVAVAARLDAGESPATVRRSLRMPPKAAERFLADVQQSDLERLRGAVCALADLELASRRGGGVVAEETHAVTLIDALAS